MDNNQTVLIATLVIGFLTTILTQVIAYKKTVDQRREDREITDRKRKWDLEDRAALAQKVIVQHAEVIAAVAENTSISNRAFTEANSQNEKIAALGLERLRVDKELLKMAAPRE